MFSKKKSVENFSSENDAFGVQNIPEPPGVTSHGFQRLVLVTLQLGQLCKLMSTKNECNQNMWKKRENIKYI